MSTHETQSASSLVSYDNWLADLGKTRVTGYRLRKAGLVKIVNIFGRLYVTREEVAAFERRAMSGEFSRENKTPKRAEVAQ